ncbi:hypothetical protein PLESTB_001244600 [Pleodorina starrii]|uniref:Uncharacterized protein n=1 Tax=Pleodorina starrii TaxID=330485 RepID=A0A9W6F609_9CHLO|nr:hypothetical protein PLESTM_000215200 [Pleodorina starrii]GLC57599.1 hypothetical protein PLESTB_001244600 [Pleodorina starrii]GLC63269.1 hypothetical protein PLESTF_000018400 [Pleodorina starrii]
MPPPTNMPTQLSLLSSSFPVASYAGVRIEKGISYIVDKVLPELPPSSAARAYGEAAVGMFKDAQQMKMAVCHGINAGLRRYAAAPIPTPDASQFATAYLNYGISKIGRSTENFLHENKAAADEAALVMQQRAANQDQRPPSNFGPGPSYYQRSAPYRSNSPQFRQQDDSGGGGAPFRQHSGSSSGGYGGYGRGGGNFGRRNSAPAPDRQPREGSGPD